MKANPSSNRTAVKHSVALMVAALLSFFSVLSATAAEVPLANAAEKADWPRVRDLLKQQPNVNAAQADGMTALHWAAYHDDTQSAQRLLAAGANAKTENRYGIAPLSLVCTNGNAELVRALLKAGADANTTVRGGETVLMTAARVGRVEPVQALLEAGARVESTDRKAQSALMWAAAEGHADVVAVLLKAGANPRARLKSGFTPLLFAAREGRIDVVRRLLKAGVDPNEAIETETGGGRAPVNGTSALLLAVENAHFELAAVLLQAGAKPNDQRSGFTPLHALTWVRKPNRGDSDDGQPPPTGSGNMTSMQFVRELVRHGADINTRLEKGSSGRGKLSLTGASAFLMASKTADVEYLRLLVELKADPSLTNKDGSTPLMAAAGIGTLAPTEEAGTEPEALASVEYLLKLGANVNHVDQNGETAMHGAAYKSLPLMVKLLTDNGAKIAVWNRKNKYGWTPLLIAEGFRPGNFKPSVETIEAIHRAMRAAGITPPPATPRPVETPKGYQP